MSFWFKNLLNQQTDTDHSPFGFLELNDFRTQLCFRKGVLRRADIWDVLLLVVLLEVVLVKIEL